MRANPFSARISAARIHFADPNGTVLRADNLATDVVGVAAKSSALQLRFVLRTLPLSFYRGWSTRRLPRACCTILRLRLGGAAFDGARLPSLIAAKPSCFHFVQAAMHCTFLTSTTFSCK